jgi:hypothetical protein
MTPQELNGHLLLILNVLIKSVQNAATKDAKLAMTKQEKYLYGILMKAIDNYQHEFGKRLNKDLANKIDEASFAFQDMLTLMMNPEHKHKALDLFAMMKLFVDGEGKIVMDDGTETTA